MRVTEDQLKKWMLEGLDGDASSHARLLRELVPILRGFYKRTMTDGHAIEDLVQETLIAVHTRRMSFDRTRLFKAWLFAVARYKMIDHFRRERQTCPIDDLEDLLASESFEDAANARMDVDRLLADLPDKQSLLIRKTRMEGQSVAEVAGETGFGESDVKVSVHLGLKALAARILGERR
ncbi:sigma-70 family RNA polymerase sigma factor [Sphingobium sufflavum]|uniref:sigma-70 family RNA polymerase sigma factor n=1 Tax=Sphingobium sufflavum TaxID=1129547 RepID=UPI001F362B16|nr:sigma-70 family RNA polymerase sigma factor [Sphingobium sufflavum]MCE7796010.1 sigma-70 family RNA polymerase sigma factor [Sphingobium sufflavum]